MSEERRECEQLHDGGQEVLSNPLYSHAEMTETLFRWSKSIYCIIDLLFTTPPNFRIDQFH